MIQIDNRSDQYGPGVGVRCIRKIKKEEKQNNAKNQKQKQILFTKCAVTFSKIGWLNGWAFTEVLSTNKIKMPSKT